MPLGFLVSEIFTDSRVLEDFVQPAASQKIVLCRFLCAVILHITLTDEIKQGFGCMKYALSHPYKFRSWKQAFWIGCAQLLIVIAVELVNLAILTTNHTIMDIIMNFLALVIIADFDDFFFQSVELEVMGNMIQEGRLELFYGTRELSDVLQTERTSSINARFKIEQNRIDHSEKNHPTKAWKKNCDIGREVNNRHFKKIHPSKAEAHRERMNERMLMK